MVQSRVPTARYERRRLEVEGQEGPRERIFREGPEGLTDAELLVAVLGSGFAGTTVREVAANVLESGTLDAIARMPAAELERFPGLGVARAAQLLAALEIGRRVYGRVRSIQSPVRTPRDALPLVQAFARAPKEHFVVVLLDTRHMPISVEVISIGSLGASIVHPREVFHPALEARAASVILVHNHPSGDTTPSEDDLEITQRLVRVGELLGIEVLDHLIVGADGHFSMREAGWV